MNVLDIKDLHFRYDEDEVLKGIDLSLEQGTYTSVLGPNGSVRNWTRNASCWKAARMKSQKRLLRF